MFKKNTENINKSRKDEEVYYLSDHLENLTFEQSIDLLRKDSKRLERPFKEFLHANLSITNIMIKVILRCGRYEERMKLRELITKFLVEQNMKIDSAIINRNGTVTIEATEVNEVVEKVLQC